MLISSSSLDAELSGADVVGSSQGADVLMAPPLALQKLLDRRHTSLDSLHTVIQFVKMGRKGAELGHQEWITGVVATYGQVDVALDLCSTHTLKSTLLLIYARVVCGQNYAIPVSTRVQLYKR
ncbi:hypothetical protein PI124_g22069 [Phytophthora idaei]|nr:hypothetical protein PI125_g19341 [Phytophthora idaei]KAG3127697.1 hypothetical protein PI126_g21734 [Phytophthora idaei]KAG3232855.1 hypothetical protein PI124_g22069 [Phytophthora idaei]